MVASDNHRTNTTIVPEVNVGSNKHKSATKNRDQRIQTYPQIPVLRTSTVTSPGFRPLPDLASSRQGVASATHKSCFVLVKTPILGLSIIAVEPMVFVVVGGCRREENVGRGGEGRK